MGPWDAREGRGRPSRGLPTDPRQCRESSTYSQFVASIRALLALANHLWWRTKKNAKISPSNPKKRKNENADSGEWGGAQAETN